MKSVTVALLALTFSGAAWAQPALKVFGLLMVAWFVALLVLRRVRPEAEQMRRLRRDARELLADVDRRLAKRAGTLKEDALRRLDRERIAPREP